MELEKLVRETKASYWLARYTGLPRARGSVAIDLGLNVGSFPLVFGRYFHSVVAVDASSACLVEAQENLASLTNVTFVHAAMAGESGGQVDLRRVYVDSTWDSKDLTTTEFDMASVKGTGYQGLLGEVEETVETLSFADLLEKFDVARVDFLKVDIEGAEFDTFINADISRIDALVMEVHYSFLGMEKVRRLVNHLLENLEFVDARDKGLFLGSWPPPDLLIMRRPGVHSQHSRVMLGVIIFAKRSISRVRGLASLLSRGLATTFGS